MYSIIIGIRIKLLEQLFLTHDTWYNKILFSFTNSWIGQKKQKTHFHYENIILAISLKSGGMNLPNERMSATAAASKLIYLVEHICLIFRDRSWHKKHLDMNWTWHLPNYFLIFSPETTNVVNLQHIHSTYQHLYNYVTYGKW